MFAYLKWPGGTGGIGTSLKKIFEKNGGKVKAIGSSDNTLIIPETTAGLFGAIKSIEKIMHIKADDKTT